MGINEDARAAAGNWKRHGTPPWPPGLPMFDDADHWTVIELENSESNLLAQSNAADIRRRLESYRVNRDVVFHKSPTGSDGWVLYCLVRATYQGGSAAGSFSEWCRIRDALADLGALNPKDYEHRKRVATLDNILEVGSFTVDKFNAPEDWTQQVFKWLSEHKPEELQVGSNEWGGYPREEAVKEAQRALGFFAEAA